MKIQYIITSLFLLFSVNSLFSQVDNERSLESVFNHWMMLNCSTADKINWNLEISQYTKQIEPLFLDAYKKGPDSKRVSEFNEASQSRFRMMQEYINSENNILSTEDTERYKNLTEEQYIQLEREDFIFGYKSNAIAGMGFLDTKSAIGFLQKLANDSSSPFQAMAILALK